MPIEPGEGTTPGFILYAAIGESMEDAGMEVDYTFNRLLTSVPLFWVSVIAMGIWVLALVIQAVISARIRKYRLQHERDNVIINESILTFVGFIDAKDKYTRGHSQRVARYTRRIAKEMGFEGEDLQHIYYIALLHDCGKIAVPDNILGKPGRLTDSEFAVIRHERYDGKGYPKGLAGKDIPLIARIICVADSFDAMNSNRVYRDHLSLDRTISEIENNRAASSIRRLPTSCSGSCAIRPTPWSCRARLRADLPRPGTSAGGPPGI